MKKILLLYTNTKWSGIGSHGTTLARELLNSGVNVIVGCPRESAVYENCALAGVPVYHLKLKNLMDFAALFRLIYIVYKEGIDIIVSNLGKEYWHVAFVSVLLRRKFVIVRHQANKLKYITNLLMTLCCDHVIAVSGAVKMALTDCGVSPGKVTVIYNGVDLSIFDRSKFNRADAKKSLSIKDGRVVIGTSGRLYEDKGGLVLFNSFIMLLKKFSNLHLLFIGEGPLREVIEREAASNAISDRVTITGFRADIPFLYSAIDIFVLPTSGLESFGLSLVEAMAMEIPVIASNIGGIPEIIADNHNGLLVIQNDPAALADAIYRLLENSSFSDIISKNGRLTVERHFSAQSFSDEFVRFLEGTQ
ncbi:glycosyltransferase family 4 protein [Candidatus Magnetomonas plexicatena]|uniref:glycosyltransferase family 4 protein n=1 Tax=Candidatus Magnetomonas plexicatena TaxID=2552947 RepID=UPI001C78A682|nr:glycosyltransferase family 4 protein [Nitrospirales bacterium LBB_01]